MFTPTADLVVMPPPRPIALEFKQLRRDVPLNPPASTAVSITGTPKIFAALASNSALLSRSCPVNVGRGEGHLRLVIEEDDRGILRR